MPFDGTTSNPLLAVLIEGRRRVETSWFRCGPSDLIPPNGHCAVFAISKQRGVSELIVPALRILSRTAYGGSDCLGLRHWNDEPERTKEDVLAAYDKAIELAVADEVAKRAELVAV